MTGTTIAILISWGLLFFAAVSVRDENVARARILKGIRSNKKWNN
jgi:hypothetical protein